MSGTVVCREHRVWAPDSERPLPTLQQPAHLPSHHRHPGHRQLEPGRALLVQLLQEAHAAEAAFVTKLRAHIAMTPAGPYRYSSSATSPRQAAREPQRTPVASSARPRADRAGFGTAEDRRRPRPRPRQGPDRPSAAAGEEKLFRNVRDEGATEALEIALYEGSRPPPAPWATQDGRARRSHPRAGAAHVRASCASSSPRLAERLRPGARRPPVTRRTTSKRMGAADTARWRAKPRDEVAVWGFFKKKKCSPITTS